MLPLIGPGPGPPWPVLGPQRSSLVPAGRGRGPGGLSRIRAMFNYSPYGRFHLDMDTGLDLHGGAAAAGRADYPPRSRTGGGA